MRNFSVCRECGAAKAIKAAVSMQINESQECKITTDDNGIEVSFDFLVHTQPLKLEGKDYTLFTVQNISHEKRREALERIFFHDVLNTAGVWSCQQHALLLAGQCCQCRRHKLLFQCLELHHGCRRTSSTITCFTIQ